MTMVEFGNNWDPEEEFDDDLLGILDFPMESLEEDGLVGDWDISNSQCLGPIPSNVLMGPPTIRNDKINVVPPRLVPGPVAPITGTPEQKQLSNHVNASTSHIQQNKFAVIQESGAFETQSPISVLESSGSCLGGKSLSIKPRNAIPVRSRSKRVRSAGIKPWLFVSPGFCTSQKISNTKRSKEREKKSFQLPFAMGFMKDSPRKIENSLPVSDRAHLRNASSHRPSVTKKCLHCESTKTPQWREGPMGPKTLCNACGVRYRSGRLFPEYRPAASPSFVPAKHSNSHKKVIEMRNKAKEAAGKIKTTGTPEQKQLSNHVSASTSHIQRNKFANVQKPGAFKIQSPVSVLESSDSFLGGKSLSIKPDDAIPERSRSKRVRPAGVKPWLLESPGFSTSQKTSNTKRTEERKKKSFQYPVAMDFTEDTPKKVQNSLAVLDCAHLLNASSYRPVVIRKCSHCESTKTPQWREGPMGPLCNACGIRYRTGRLFPEYQPAAGPSFVPSKHSNYHRKVIEMRNKVKQLGGKIKVGPMSSACSYNQGTITVSAAGVCSHEQPFL